MSKSADWLTPREPDRVWMRYKVIRIHQVWAETKKDAMKAVQEDRQDEHLILEFAREDGPKSVWHAILKQIIG